MGKNYLQAIPIRTAYQKKLEQFTASLGNAIGKGEPIPFADNDLTYTLNLQNERINEKGIELDYEVFRRIKDDNQFFEVADWKDKHYATAVGFGVCGVKREVRKDGKTIYHYVCPECGYHGTDEIIQEGQNKEEIDMKALVLFNSFPVYFIIGGLVLTLILFLIVLFVAGYVKAAPDTAIIISGMGKRKILIGKAGFRIPFLQRLDRLSLRVFQVDIKTDEAIPTSNFINIRVDGVANLKISSDPQLLNLAAEAILNMNEEDLIQQVQQVLQGNMREIIGTVDIKRLVQDRQGVAQSVKENVVPDMAKMGI